MLLAGVGRQRAFFPALTKAGMSHMLNLSCPCIHMQSEQGKRLLYALPAFLHNRGKTVYKLDPRCGPGKALPGMAVLCH